MFSINLNAGHGQVVTMELWLPTNPKLKQAFEDFKQEGRVLNRDAAQYLLHHFRPQTEENGKVKFSYARVHQTGVLLQIDEKEYLSFLEERGVLENANVPSSYYYRLSEPFREGRYFAVQLPAKYASRLRTYEKFPTQFITEEEAMHYAAKRQQDYPW